MVSQSRLERLGFLGSLMIQGGKERGGGRGNVPSKRISLAHWRQCSILCGNECNKQTGVSVGGGSTEAPYDSVTWGTQTWTFPLVPEVPINSSESHD